MNEQSVPIVHTPSELVTASVAAKALGVSRKTLNAWVRRSKIPVRKSVRLGYAMYSQEDIQRIREWMNATTDIEYATTNAT